MKEQNWNRYILKSYAEKPIAFIPVLARIGGSAAAGLFISQMLYWCNKGHDRNWVYKTIEDMKDETFLSRSEQERAISKWTALGVIEKAVRGVPPKRHFRIHLSALEQLLDKDFQIAENDKSISRGEQNSITESISETTNKYSAAEIIEPVTLLLEKFAQGVGFGAEKFRGNVRQREALVRLIKQNGIEEIENIVAALPTILMEEKFAPVITSPTELEQKMPKLKAYVARRQLSGKGRRFIIA